MMCIGIVIWTLLLFFQGWRGADVLVNYATINSVICVDIAPYMDHQPGFFL